MQEDTRERILDAAEALFAEQGFATTSLRAITAAAGANLAAVNYHFGSKDGLIREVYARRIEPLNRNRLARLAALEAAGAPPGAAAILEAFIVPTLETCADPARGGARFARLLGRMYAESSAPLREFIHGLYVETLDRYKEALARALPQLPRVELYWRLHFVLGVLSYTMAGTDMMKLISDCRLDDPADIEALLSRLLPFLTAGLEAPWPGRAASGEQRRARA